MKVENLYFEYPAYSGNESKKIMDGLSLLIRPGELVVVIGGPESGKSTLSLILSALVPDHSGGSLSGTIELDGINVLKSKTADLIENCGVIFQDPEKQIITTDCLSEAVFALESLGMPEEQILKRADKALDFFNIEHLRGVGTYEISGGEKKKLALAGVFGVNPDLWILDEGLEELDSPSRKDLVGFLRESGKTVIIITSKYYEVLENADSFYLLKNGRLSEKMNFPFTDDFISELKGEGVVLDFESVKAASEMGGSGDSSGLLAAENISFSYNERKSSGGGGFMLQVDRFCLEENEIVSIVGRNGCGKSTLGKILCGLLKPESGRITTGGKSAEPGVLNSYCAYMFQNPDYQIFLPTVSEELGWGLKEAGFTPEEIRERVKNAIVDFRLPDGDSPPALMSFSARKRLQAAVYYLLQRPVFILDEADTGLSFRDFRLLLKQLRAVGRGIIVITHNLELAAAVSDRVLGMVNGKITEDLEDISSEGISSWLAASEKRTGRGSDR